MKNFQLLANNVDVIPLLHQIQHQSDLWDEYQLRTKHAGTAHDEVSDIWIFFNELQTLNEDIINDKDVIPYQAWYKLSTLRPIVFALMRQVEAHRLGRVIITKLPPGKIITPHVDGGAPATYFERYQIALQCLPGNIFKIGDEEVSFRTGEIWWIDNRVEHSVINNSVDDRIVCIVDLRCD